MAIYSLGGVGGVGTTGVASTEIIAASTEKPKIMEICISQVAATASLFGLGRPAAIGVTPTTPVTLLDEQDGGGPVGLTKTAVAWGTPPTVPTAFLRRLCTPATIGAGIIWTFPRGLGMPTSGSVVIWNAGTNSIVHYHVVVDELREARAHMAKLDGGDGRRLMGTVTVKVYDDGAMSIEGPTTEPEWCIAALDHAQEALRNQLKPKEHIVIPGYDTSIERVMNKTPALPAGVAPGHAWRRSA